MTAEKLLARAKDVVTKRRREYGEPVDLFDQVAIRWLLTLGTEVSPSQVVLCLVDLELARLVNDPTHVDSIVDLVAYAAVLGGVVDNLEPRSSRWWPGSD